MKTMLQDTSKKGTAQTGMCTEDRISAAGKSLLLCLAVLTAASGVQAESARVTANFDTIANSGILVTAKNTAKLHPWARDKTAITSFTGEFVFPENMERKTWLSRNHYKTDQDYCSAAAGLIYDSVTKMLSDAGINLLPAKALTGQPAYRKLRLKTSVPPTRKRSSFGKMHCHKVSAGNLGLILGGFSAIRANQAMARIILNRGAILGLKIRFKVDITPEGFPRLKTFSITADANAEKSYGACRFTMPNKKLLLLKVPLVSVVKVVAKKDSGPAGDLAKFDDAVMNLVQKALAMFSCHLKIAMEMPMGCKCMQKKE